MAQQRARPAGEHGSHEPSFWGKHRVTHGIDASVNRVKPAHAYPPLNRRLREAELPQLIRRLREAELPQLMVRDHPVLPSGQNRDLSVTWAELRSHIDLKSAQVANSAPEQVEGPPREPLCRGSV